MNFTSQYTTEWCSGLGGSNHAQVALRLGVLGLDGLVPSCPACAGGVLRPGPGDLEAKLGLDGLAPSCSACPVAASSSKRARKSGSVQALATTLAPFSGFQSSAMWAKCSRSASAMRPASIKAALVAATRLSIDAASCVCLPFCSVTMPPPDSCPTNQQ